MCFFALFRISLHQSKPIKNDNGTKRTSKGKENARKNYRQKETESEMKQNNRFSVTQSKRTVFTAKNSTHLNVQKSIFRELHRLDTGQWTGTPRVPF
jgi:hypothetical protein